MTTATTTLTDFLLARIAEDEAAARGALENKRYFQPVVWAYYDADYGGLLESNYNESGLGQPARVLAECEAKRRIVGLHDTLSREETEYSGWQQLGIDTLHALAAVYADHPDYRDEWKP